LYVLNGYILVSNCGYNPLSPNYNDNNPFSIYNDNYTGWWYTYPLWKNMKVSWEGLFLIYYGKMCQTINQYTIMVIECVLRPIQNVREIYHDHWMIISHTITFISFHITNLYMNMANPPAGDGDLSLISTIQGLQKAEKTTQVSSKRISWMELT
jgi:hypothetical protein